MRRDLLYGRLDNAELLALTPSEVVQGLERDVETRSCKVNSKNMDGVSPERQLPACPASGRVPACAGTTSSVSAH